MKPIVVAITGASGAPYAVRLLQCLVAMRIEALLSVSPSGAAVLNQELGIRFDLEAPDLVELLAGWSASDFTIKEHAAPEEFISYVPYQDYFSPPASGSYLTGGMVVCPCSGTTLSAIAAGASGNLIQRAAEVHLKERRKLILVPRETPLSLPTIENMRRATQAGAIVLPASPGWYHGVTSTGDLVDFVVARILDQLEVEHQLMSRWGA